MTARALVDRYPAAVFLALNTGIVFTVIAWTVNLDYPALYLFATLIIAAQYRPFRRQRLFRRRLFVFYAGFILFCWSFTLASLPADAGQLTSIEAIVGLVLRGVAYVLFAHLYGFVLLVVPIAGINQALFPDGTVQPQTAPQPAGR
jgi:hypothetical protein